MKKTYLTLLVFTVVAVFLCDAQAKPGSMASSIKKVPTGSVPKAAGGAPGASSEPVQNPLDTPFRPSHTYPGTDIPINVIPISMFPAPENENILSACGAFRINKNWVLTAAHCLEDFGTKNQRISFSIHPGDNGISEVQFRKVNKNNPANADIYFYREGYSSSRKNKFGHAEDIALVRLDEKEDKAAVQASKQATAVLDSFSGMESFIGADNMRGLKKAQQKMTQAQKARKAFFNQPLNRYSIFVTPPEGVSYFQDQEGTVFEFRAYENYSAKGKDGLPIFHRDAPRAHKFHFHRPASITGSHELLWDFQGKRPDGTNIATSGSPVIINGFVVSNTSGPKNGRRATPLYVPQVEQFFQRTMGKEYPQGLCVSPYISGPLANWKPKR